MRNDIELFGNPPVYRGSALTVRDRAARPSDLCRVTWRWLASEGPSILAGVLVVAAVVFAVVAAGSGVAR